MRFPLSLPLKVFASAQVPRLPLAVARVNVRLIHPHKDSCSLVLLLQWTGVGEQVATNYFARVILPPVR